MTGRLEDYELGYRLIAAGAKFKFNLHAIGYHHDKTNLDIWLSRIRQEGVANIRIADRHPDLRNQLFADAENRESQWSTTRTMIRNAAFGNLLGWDLVATMFLYLSHFCERLKLRGPWFHITGALREYQYWRGVREAIGNKDNLAAWLQEAPMPRPVSPDAPRVDCMHYPSDDELDELLSKAPVQGFRLTYRGVELFSIPPYAGMEPLRKNHIKYFLLKMCGEGFNPVLALNFIETSDRIGFLCESNLLK
jgi:hypothetical protein